MWGMRQGAKAYLTKPFSEDELSEVIERILSAARQSPTSAA
jgi:twitching motility two-component system response regulator PilH